MAVARKAGLGRGLSALLDDIRAPDAGSVQTIAIADIAANPTQPRRYFEAAAMADLTDSIKERGVLQPILVRPSEPGRFEIVAGERRWRAAQAAGLHEIPALVRVMDDGQMLEVAIVENVQRADLNAIEEAEGYRRLIEEYGHTQDALGRIVGKSRSHVSNTLRLLELPELVRRALIEQAISMGHARALLGANDPVGLLAMILQRGLSVRETEARAQVMAEPESAGTERRAASTRDADIVALERQVTAMLGLKVGIDARGAKGTVELNYTSLEQLDMIIQRLTGGRV